MKLKAKFEDEDFKLGEVVDAIVECLGKYDKELRVIATAAKGGQHTFYYSSIKAFADEWEDAPEEPLSTSFYTIVDGKVKHCIFYRERISGCPSNAWAYLKDDGKERIRQLKEVGLYFETEEEAEKAVERLRAWKRLKDKGFRFNRWTIPEEPKTPHIKLVIEAEVDVPDSPYDLNSLFLGGEE